MYIDNRGKTRKNIYQNTHKQLEKCLN